MARDVTTPPAALRRRGTDAARAVPPAGYCEVSTATRLLGDQWSLLIVRELCVGNVRFSDIHDALPGLSRSLLSARLRYLERLGILERQPTEMTDRRSKQQYLLTEVGRGLTPVLRALGDWALAFRASAPTDQEHDVALLLRGMQEGISLPSLPKARMSIQLYFTGSSEPAGYLRIDGSGARGCTGQTQGLPDLTVRTSARTLNDLSSGRRTCREALSCRDISFEGPLAYAQAFADWFPDRPALRDAEPTTA